MKAILSKPYFVIPLALAGLLANGALLIGGLSLLGRVFSPEAPAEVAESEQTPSQPAADVEPAPAPEPPMVTLQDALPVGYEAAVMAQTAKTEEEWNAVAKQWLAAVKILEEVPKTSPDYPAAKAKWKEYLKNVDIAGAKANAAAKASLAGYSTSNSLSLPEANTKELRWPDGTDLPEGPDAPIPIALKKEHLDALVRLGDVDSNLVKTGVEVGVNAGNLILMPPGTPVVVLSTDGLMSQVEISYALDSSGNAQGGKFWVMSMLVI